jgi:uncharacterized protein
MNRNFSLLVKPASYCCNLRCPYCFYLKKIDIFGAGRLRMNDDVLTSMMRKFMALGMPLASIGWQGGEPTLMGLDFFRRAVSLQRQFAQPGQRIANGLQTNGTLLDDEWGEFLHANKFLVGLSVDGSEEIHDLNRVRASGRGSHAAVMRGMEVLKRHSVEFNVLTLISSANQDRPLEIYHYLKSLGVNYHQYIECVEFDEEGKLGPLSVEPLKWGALLCAIFDAWFIADTRTVSVRLFDSILRKLVDKVESSCNMGSDCRQYFVVEFNGDIFPCDFYVRPELKLGNIVDDDFDALIKSPLYRDFGARKRTWNLQCDGCEFLGLCAGCCPKNRPGQNSKNMSALCEGWKMFYGHTLGRFRQLAEQIVRERHMATFERTGPRPGRNTPCPCGSGRKYKNCCGTSARPGCTNAAGEIQARPGARKRC